MLLICVLHAIITVHIIQHEPNSSLRTMKSTADVRKAVAAICFGSADKHVRPFHLSQSLDSVSAAKC